MLKKQKDISYPNDFVSPECTIIDEVAVNKMIQQVGEHSDSICTGDTLVQYVTTGFIEVYKLIGECEIEVN